MGTKCPSAAPPSRSDGINPYLCGAAGCRGTARAGPLGCRASSIHPRILPGGEHNTPLAVTSSLAGVPHNIYLFPIPCIGEQMIYPQKCGGGRTLKVHGLSDWDWELLEVCTPVVVIGVTIRSWCAVLEKEIREGTADMCMWKRGKGCFRW